MPALTKFAALLTLMAHGALGQESGGCGNVLVLTATPAQVNTTITISRTLTVEVAPLTNASYCATTTTTLAATPTSYAIQTATVTAYRTVLADAQCAGKRPQGCHSLARCPDRENEMCDCAVDTSGRAFCFHVRVGAGCEDHFYCETNADCREGERCMTEDSTCCDQRCVMVSSGSCSNPPADAKRALMMAAGRHHRAGIGRAAEATKGGKRPVDGSRWTFSLGDS